MLTSSFFDFKKPEKEARQRKKMNFNQRPNNYKIRTGSEARKNRCKINWECDVVVTGKKFL